MECSNFGFLKKILFTLKTSIFSSSVFQKMRVFLLLLLFIFVFCSPVAAQIPNLAPLDIALEVSATQFTYNRWLDYIFNNGVGSTASPAANASFYNAVNQVMSVFCDAEEFISWGTNLTPLLTTLAEVRAYYISLSLTSFIGYSHHKLDNPIVYFNFDRDGLYANFTSIITQTAKTAVAPGQPPVFVTIEGFYNNQYKFIPQTNSWCIKVFFAYTQNGWPNYNLSDAVNAPYIYPYSS